MIRLNLTTEPRWIELLPGLRLLVSPVTTAIMASARADVSLDRLDPDAPKEVLAVAMAQGEIAATRIHSRLRLAEGRCVADGL